MTFISETSSYNIKHCVVTPAVRISKLPIIAAMITKKALQKDQKNDRNNFN